MEIDHCGSFLVQLHFTMKRKKFLTSRRFLNMLKHFNDIQYSDIFIDKVKFNKLFYDFVKRKWIYAPEKTNQEIIDFVIDMEKVIVKPTNLSQGKGIYVLSESDLLDVETANLFCKDVKDKSCLIEEYIKQHPNLSRLNETSVNTIRVYTVIDNKGKSNIIFAAIRVGGQKSCVDNYHHGGIGYPIDIDTGVVCGQGVDFAGNEYIYHPGSGILMLGYQIPKWCELKKLVFKASKMYPKCRYIGWDIAITENGLEMVEGNYYADAGFLQAIDKKGKYNILIPLRK